MFNISQSCNQRFEVKCGPRSEVIVSGTQKLEIQVKVKAFAHAAVDVSERGIASIHSDVRSIMVKFNVMKIITVLQRAHQIYMEVRKTLLWDGDGLGTRRVWW
jgi:hypothetical protein